MKKISEDLSSQVNNQTIPHNEINHKNPIPLNENINGHFEMANELEPKTPLGRKLMEIRQNIVASGEPLLNWDEINQEVARRRGEIE